VPVHKQGFAKGGWESAVKAADNYWEAGVTIQAQFFLETSGSGSWHLCFSKHSDWTADQRLVHA